MCAEGVKGAIADFVCFHAPLSLPQERNPRNIKNQASIHPKSKIINQKKAFPDD